MKRDSPKADLSLVLFFRVPELGKVKRRLEASLGKPLTLALYQKLLERTLQVLRDFKRLFPATILVGAYSGDLQVFPLSTKFDLLYQQVGANIGEDLFNLSHQLLSRISRKLLVMGSDCPEITPNYLRGAYELLSQFQIVLGPSQDGGYNLIGFTAEMKQHLSLLFANIPWGTERVLRETLHKVEGLVNSGIKVGLLKETTDLDRLEDLLNLWSKGTLTWLPAEIKLSITRVVSKEENSQ